MNAPYVSLCVICGDEGVKTLSRLLGSVINRDEPLADQIVIGFNGKNLEAFQEALRQYVPAGAVPGGWNAPLGGGQHVRFDTFIDTWKSDFSAARNETWKLATGEWVMWLDTDDIVANASDTKSKDGLAAILACERDYGLPPVPADAPSSTLKRWLESLPTDCNAVLAPYDYAMDGNGYVLVRQLMKRIVRRSAGHIWRNPIHEVLYPNGSVGERSVQNLGLLVRHYPAESVLKRVERNKDIVLKLEERPELLVYADARHAFDRANAYITLGDLKAADAAIKQAISLAPNDIDSYTFRLARCGICVKAGALEAALSEALAAIGVRPTIADAYYAASEVFFLHGKMDAVIKFAELGMACAPQLGQLDQPLALWVQPRAQAATAYLNLGQPEKALKLAQEAVSRYPNDALALEVLTNAQRALDKSRAIEGLLDAAEYALRNQNVLVTSGLLSVMREMSCPTSFRGIETLPRFKALRAAVRQADTYVEFNPSSLDAAHPAMKALQEKTGRPFTSDEYVATLDGGPLQSVDERALHFHAKLEDLQLIDHVPLGNHQLALVTPRDSAKRHFVFYCPHAAELWKPSDLETKGLGGSEGSVAYLARELARRGYPVTVYAPGASSNPHTHAGVTERSVQSFDHADWGGNVLIACRAPWVMRHPEHHNGRDVYAWHQDNGYESKWSWTPEIDQLLAGSLHVSQWARNGLMNEVGLTNLSDPRHHVIGNGIDEACVSWLTHGLPRNPNRIIYASDPTRGLAPLLNAWPLIREKNPEAELHVFCSFRVMLALAQSMPGLPDLRFQRELEQQMLTTPGVVYRGWVPHAQLIREMQTASVYAYPGGPMPEGFGVSLVQAEACGLRMVYPEAGALPDVLTGRAWMGDALKLRTDPEYLSRFVLDALMQGEVEEVRRIHAQTALTNHSWSVVADRFLKAVNK